MKNSLQELHAIHPYPCKFPASVVLERLPAEGVILDPYCGSGTTLLEAAMRGLRVIGADCNPIAVLISRCKLLNITKDEMAAALNCAEAARAGRSSTERLAVSFEFAGRDHWFSDDAQQGFEFCLRLIRRFERDSAPWIVCATAMSAITNTYSNQDSETRYCRREKDHSTADILNAFSKRVIRIVAAIQARGPLTESSTVIHQDIRAGVGLDDESVDSIITSPPYVNTMDYYLYHKQRMNLLGFSFEQTKSTEIGSRHQFSSKKDPLSTWEIDFKKALSESLRLLKPSGTAWYVIGDSQVAGSFVDAGALVVRLADELGWHASIVESVPMQGKSRLFASSFQRPGKSEHVIKIGRHA